jgi:class 3 adenylate cyclase/tetratricopeptide (TPR) repeat protein
VVSCPACSAQNPDASRFCGACGVPLGGAVCPACDAPNPAGHRFCGQCGSPLERAAQVAEPESLDERKLATVLFADVVGFTSLAERSDPERVARTVDAAFRRLAEIVTEHGGTIDKYMGDSLMAVFGVPAAHDDDAERAVAAGLAMRAVGGDLAFSIGINTGEVMVMSLGRDDAPTVVGDAVNVAARLEKAASAGEVLVGPLTAQLAGANMSLRERDPVMLKGKREPVSVFEAVAVRRGGDGVPETRVPLVGRADELSFLGSQWRRVVRGGRPAVVLITGDAGVGTTRLAEELAARVSSEGRVAWASYPAYGGMGGSRVADEIIGAVGLTGDPEIDRRVRSLAGEFDPALKEIDPAGLYQEQLWAFARLLGHASADQPLLLVIDDFHRAGDKSLQLVADLVSRVDSGALLVALVGRPQPSEWLARFPAASTVHLDALGRDDALKLVEVLGDDGDLGRDDAEFLAGRSGGNPLFLRELVALAADRRRVAGGDGGLPAVPPTLRTILAARLDALAADEKSALQHLAVLGQPVPVARVKALGLVGGEAVLESLAARDLVRRRGPEPRYDVADPLLAEVAYEALPHNVRAERHRLAGSEADTVDERVRHFERAVEYAPDDGALAEEAATVLAVAGRELFEVFRHDDAARVLQRAVELGEDRPATVLLLAEAQNVQVRSQDALDTLALLPSDLGDPALEAQRIHLTGTAKMFTDAAREALVHLDDAAQRWRAVGNGSKEAWALANKGAALFNMSRMSEAAASLEAAITVFDAAGDRPGLLAAQSFLALIHPADPRVPEWLEDAVRHAEEVGDRSREHAAMISLAWNHYFRSRLGGPDDVAGATANAVRLAELAHDLGNRDFYAHGTSLRANLARLAGQLDVARAVLEEGREFMAGFSSAETILPEAVTFAVELAEGGDPQPPEAIESLNPVIGIAALIVAEAYVLAGRPQDARAYYRSDQARPQVPSLEPLLPGLTLALSRVLTGELDEAGLMLERAVECADAIRAAPAGAAARALMAEVLVRTGSESARARELLDAARAAGVGGVAGAIVMRAAAVLDEPEARQNLPAVVAALHVPGLLLGLDVD